MIEYGRRVIAAHEVVYTPHAPMAMVPSAALVGVCDLGWGTDMTQNIAYIDIRWQMMYLIGKKAFHSNMHHAMYAHLLVDSRLCAFLPARPRPEEAPYSLLIRSRTSRDPPEARVAMVASLGGATVASPLVVR